METRKRKLNKLSMADQYAELCKAEKFKYKLKKRKLESAAPQTQAQAPQPMQDILTTATVISVLQQSGPAPSTPFTITHEQRIDFSGEPGSPLRVSSSSRITRPDAHQEGEMRAASIGIQSTYSFGTSGAHLLPIPMAISPQQLDVYSNQQAEADALFFNWLRDYR